MRIKNYILFGFFFLVANMEVSAQCAMCRAVLESGTDNSTAEGINNGILYLMVFPYLLIAVIAFFIYKARKESKKNKIT